MVIELLVAGGALVAGLNRIRQPKKTLGQVISPVETPGTDQPHSNGHDAPANSASPLNAVGALGDGIVTTINSSYTDLKTTVQAYRDEKFPSLLEDVRGQHMRELASAPEQVEISKAEKKARFNILVASGGLVAAIGGGLLFTPLYLLSAAGSIYLFKFVFPAAYRALVHERRMDMNALTVLIVTGAVVGGLFLAASLAIWFAMLNDLLVVKTEDQSKRGLVNLFGEQPRSVWILVNGSEIEVPFEEVQAGNIVVVSAGMAVPADGVIRDGIASIDQMMLTGEAQPAEKSVGDPVFAATVVLSGKICVQVEQTGEETVAARIGQVLEQTTDYRETMQQEWVTTLEKYMWPMMALGGLALPAAGLSGALAVLWYYPGYRMVFFGPLSMLSFLHVAARQGILIKDGRSLELLDDVDTIVFDKTGTLTMAQPHIGQIYTCGELSETELLVYAAAAEHRQTHPIARAILEAVDERGLDLPPIDNAHYEVGYGIKVRVEERTVRVGSNRFMDMEEIAIPEDIQARQEACHEQGYSLVMVAIDDVLEGSIELRPTVRPEAAQIVEQMHERNLELIILSGDHDAPTKRLAEELGIDRYYAEVLPEDKAGLVAELQQAGRSVCFVGDGINDAIALKQANVSVSLRGATTVAIDTAQIVLMDESIEQLAQLFDVVDDYESNMKFNILASTLPSLAGIAGTFLFGWGFLAAGLLVQITTPLSLYHTLRPLFAAPRGDANSNGTNTDTEDSDTVKTANTNPASDFPNKGS